MKIIKKYKSIFKLYEYAYHKYSFKIVTLTGLGFLCGLLEGVGVNTLIPLFATISGNTTYNDNIISETMKSIFDFIHVDFSLKYLLIFVCIVFIFKAIVLIISDYIRVKITSDYEEEIRKKLLSKTFNANWTYLLKQKLGYLENTLMIDVQNSAMLLQQISTSIMIITSLTMYIAIAVNISLNITLITIALGMFIFFFFKPLIQKTREISKESAIVRKNIAHYVNENIIGMKTIKAMALGEQVVETGNKYFNDLKKQKIKIFLLSNITGSLLQPISLIFICIIFAISYKYSNIDIASLAVIIYLIQRIFLYFRQMQSSLHKINETTPYLENLAKYEQKIDAQKEEEIGSKHFNFQKTLEFKNINFSYNKKKQILHNINFNISKGEMIGLIGPSGCGKTTIVDMILRLLTPNDGDISIDKINIRTINTNLWRKNIGYISQDIFLINGTIEDNIRFYNKNTTNDEIKSAAKMANIYDFIQELPNKFLSQIGDRGLLLSGGQKQRIIIARVLAQKPKLLILDEATSALDNESELKIQKVIENLKGKITTLTIAHRLSTIMNSDKIIVLDNGKILEINTPTNLLKNKDSYFYKTYNIRKDETKK